MQTVVRVLASIAALVLVAATSTLRAQQSDPTTRPLVRGDHVRLYQSASDSTPVVGRLRSIGNDSISVVPDEDATVRVLFAHRDVARIEVERDAGMRDQVSTVMAGLGMLGGAAAALYQCLDNRDQCAAEADARARCREWRSVCRQVPAPGRRRRARRRATRLPHRTRTELGGHRVSDTSRRPRRYSALGIIARRAPSARCSLGDYEGLGVTASGDRTTTCPKAST